MSTIRGISLRKMAAVAAGLALIWLPVLTAPPAHAAWEENGAPLCTYEGHQYGQAMAPDGAGGWIVAWSDMWLGPGEEDIYAQRIDAAGEVQWLHDGIIVCDQAFAQEQVSVVSDGAGGAIIAWVDFRTELECDIYAQRVNASGVRQWTSSGIAVCTASGNQTGLRMVSDGEGGAYLAWEDYRDTGGDIYCQRIDGSGVPQWTANGIAVCTAPYLQFDIRMTANQDGSAIIAWRDGRSTGVYDIFAQRITASGSMTWASNGSAVTVTGSLEESFDICPRITGGAVVAWVDFLGDGFDIRAQALDISGTRLWASNGAPVCMESGMQTECRIADDGADGAFVAWLDSRIDMFDVYMNRIRYDGTLGYSAAGLPVSDVWAMREDLAVAPDGGGGFLVAWSDHRNGADGIYAQRFTTAGMFEWEDDGAVVCTANNNQSEATIAPDGTGGTFLAWVDTRCITAERNIYCQVIERFGYWGDPAPAIAIVNDVPGDQGGFVTVAWEASRLDPAPYRQITHYGVWRAISPAAAAHRDGTEQGVSGSKLIKERLNDPIAGTVRSELREGQMWYWELAGMQMANFFEGYSMTVATLFDSSAASTEYHYFQVSAHTADEQVFWTSAPDSGYSVDNLAPAAPEGLAGEQSYEPVGLRLTWYPNAEEDLAGYRVYRGTASDFTPGPGNMIGGTADTLLFDDEWRWYEGYYYKVAAVDIHGNESGYALLAPDGVTGEEVVDMPTAAALRQNYPNPFNPSTTIRYYLPEDGHVRIEVLDIAGRRVCRIIDRRETRGWHEITWHGRSETGGAVASGAYFYRLVSSRDTITRKMVLLK